MSLIQFNYATFAQGYPQFSDMLAFPQATLQLYWNTATNFLSNNTASCGMTIPQRTTSLNLLTAHIAALSTIAAKGENTGLLQSAGIDKVNVSLTPPPEVNQWQWWLNQTPYGQQYLALMQVMAVGGFFVGGYPTTFTLRR